MFLERRVLPTYRLTFNTTEDVLDALGLVAVWPAAWGDLQNIIWAIFCEELQRRTGEVRRKKHLWQEGGMWGSYGEEGEEQMSAP